MVSDFLKDKLLLRVCYRHREYVHFTVNDFQHEYPPSVGYPSIWK